ncbi:MAG: leucyl aminopeptidase [Planctomycetota bacterium]|nr:MAG: leucyl aminopeptidase [Planctomycetota bacterium]
MRTVIVPSAAPSRTELTAVVLPEGARPSLPATAPDPASWKADFGKEKGASLLLRGNRGQRWLLLRVPRKPAPADLREAAGKARLEAERLERSSLCLDLSALANDPALARAAAEGAGMAGYDPGVMKKERKKAKVRRIALAGVGRSRAVAAEVRLGALGAAANLAAREVANLPSNVLTPKEFARRARALVRNKPRLSCRVFGEKAMAAMKMGSLLGVARGSKKEAQLVHLSYMPKGRSKGKVAVVGKGLIFDSGGISLKPSANMDQMKFDMCGAAAVYGLFHALANGFDCPYEVHGVMACVENMPGGNAQNPGDIVQAMNGKTIEVLNTDAEGRLVLADALCYAARKIKPDRIYDLATLTGACIIALGHTAAAVLGNDQKLIDALRGAGDATGERVWQLPIWDVHRDLIKGRYADLQNIYPAGQGAGTIAGGVFLENFVDDLPWVHIDIASTAWEGPEASYYSAGGRGTGVRLMIEVLRG